MYTPKSLPYKNQKLVVGSIISTSIDGIVLVGAVAKLKVLYHCGSPTGVNEIIEVDWITGGQISSSLLHLDRDIFYILEVS